MLTSSLCVSRSGIIDFGRFKGSSVSYLVVALRGRLGNNLWQFASGLGIAKALGARLCFDGHLVPEPVRLLPVLIPGSYEEATPAELRHVGVASFRPGPRAGLERWMLRSAHEYRRRLVHKSPAQTIFHGNDMYREELFKLDLPAYIAGNFQDERYFDAVTDEVAAAIHWPAGAADLPDDLGTTVAVSFRRGDYNLFAAALPLSYYDRAMRTIADAVGTPTFVLFGDDSAFVDLFAERAERLGYSVTSALPLGPDPITQLRLQSQCDHAIVANSTFAWWGAWLGDRRSGSGRIVIAPAGLSGFARRRWNALEEAPGEKATYDLSTVWPTAMS
jgi:hypothetical protein